MAFINNLGKKLTGVAGDAAEKAKDVAEYAKVKTEIASENKKMQQGYMELGKLYFEQGKDVDEGSAVEIFNSIKEAQDNIASMEAKLAAKKEE